MAQLTEWSLPIPEDLGSHTVDGSFFKVLGIYCYLFEEKKKSEANEARTGSSKKHDIVFLVVNNFLKL